MKRYLEFLNESNQSLGHALIRAVRSGNLDECIELIKNGADIHFRREGPTVTAAEYGHLDILKYFHELGCSLRVENDLALRLACYNGHYDVVMYLLDNGSDINARSDGALFNACEKEHYDIVKELLERGAEVNQNSIMKTMKLKNLDILKLLFSHRMMLNNYIYNRLFVYLDDKQRYDIFNFILNRGYTGRYRDGIIEQVNFLKKKLNIND